MWINLKIKWPWFLSFLNREYDTDTKEILRRNFDTQGMDVFGDEYQPSKEQPESESEEALSNYLKRQDLISQIQMARTKLGGPGICCYCGEWHANPALHEARCPKRPETARPARG